MALAFAEALQLGATAKNIAWAADVVGTGDYLKDKFKQSMRYYKRKRYGSRNFSRKRRRFSRRRRSLVVRRRGIGHRVGSGVAKRVSLDVDASSEPTRTFQWFELTQIQKSINDNIDRRQRDVVNLRGFNICMTFRNKLNVPLMFNVCVLHDRRQAGIASALANGDFFRGNGTERAVTFDAALGGIDLYCKKLNTDRFIVLKRKKFAVAGRLIQDYTYGDMKNWRNLNMWIPIRRQLRFEQDRCQTPIILVWWFDAPDTAPLAGATPDAVETSVRSVTYFREPKN